jgi:hypothetical protein
MVLQVCAISLERERVANHPTNEFLRLRIRFRWERKRFICFMKNPSLDFRGKLILLAVFSPLAAILGGLLDSYGLLEARYSFFCYMGSAVLGLLVLATILGRFIDRHFADFKATKMFGVGLVALSTYVAHGMAQGEVNAIFHIDASALPHTVTAASAFFIARWLYSLVMLPLLFASTIYFMTCFWLSRGAGAVTAFAVFFSAALWSGLLHFQVVNDENRTSNLYQIALNMDFNKKSFCSGLPPKSEGVVFLGSNQSRAIAAPQLISLAGNSKSIFRKVQVPTTFSVVNCLAPIRGLPAGDLKDLMK